MSFLVPGFLWGLIGVGVPILVHLLNLRYPRRLLFSSTAFIQRLEVTLVRRQRLREWLVLATRVSGIVCLVFVFAQPFLPTQHATLRGDGAAVLLDRSLSMGRPAADGQVSIWQKALLAVKGFGRAGIAEERIQLIGQRRAEGRSSFADKLGELQLSGKQEGWDGIAGRQALMDSASAGQLFVFSDFQRGKRDGDLWTHLSRRREVVLVPQAARATANVYVDSVWLDDAFVRARSGLALHIRLKNGGNEAVRDCPVKVRMGGRQVATLQVSLEAGQLTTVVTQVQLVDEKLVEGEVAVEDTPVTFDNSYYFVLRPVAVIGVVEVAAESKLREVYRAEPLFTYAFSKPGEVNYADLQRASLVIVREIASVDAGLRAALAAVVRRGGSVVVVPAGGEASRAGTLALLGALGVSGVEWQPAGQLQELALPGGQDPFFKEVFGAQSRQVALPQVKPVMRVARGGQDILRMRDGDGYLTAYGERGGGHTYVFTAPLSAEYGDFSRQGLFVPVMYRLAMLSYQASQQPAYRLSQTSITLAVPGAVADAEKPVQLIRDSLVLVAQHRQRGVSLQLEVPKELRNAGFYRVQQGGKTLTTLAFNLDKQESELAAYSVAELRQLVAGRPNVRVLDDGNPETVARFRAEGQRRPLWRYFLLGALGCLLAEGLLLRFRNRGASVVAA